MKVNQNFRLLYVLIIICQMVMCNYTNLGPYILLTMLPAAILCLPTNIGAIGCMLIAFASGMAVDWLSEGLLGLNAASLTAVAAVRKELIRIFLGEDIISRNDSFSIRKNGLGKVSLTLISATTVFLAVYILIDGAGTRPLWFSLVRFGASLACCWPLGLIVIRILTTDERK